jgi:ribosomal protein S18 acetylase RimI-like enzyme
VSRDFTVRAYGLDDEAWATERLGADLGGRHQARRGSLVDVLDADALIAERDGTPVGLLAFRPDGDDVELAALVVSEPGRGIGTALVEAFLVTARERRHRSAWVVTTNDNLDALRFYQRRGFRLAALRAGAVDESRRRLKPTIAPVAASGIPIRDELELTIDLRAMGPEGRPGR